MTVAPLAQLKDFQPQIIGMDADENRRARSGTYPLHLRSSHPSAVRILKA